MLDIALHTGIEHPNLLWILVPAFLSFVTGLALGTNADRVRELTGLTALESTN